MDQSSFFEECLQQTNFFCERYNSICKLSKLVFVVSGGIFYHMYARKNGLPRPQDTLCDSGEDSFDTPDTDGYFIILPLEIRGGVENIKRLEGKPDLEAYKQYAKSIVPIVEEAAKAFSTEKEPLAFRFNLFIDMALETLRKDLYTYSDDLGAELAKDKGCLFDFHFDILMPSAEARKPYNNGTPTLFPAELYDEETLPCVQMVNQKFFLCNQIYTYIKRCCGTWGDNATIRHYVDPDNNELDKFAERWFKRNGGKAYKTAKRLRWFIESSPQKNQTTEEILRELKGTKMVKIVKEELEGFSLIRDYIQSRITEYEKNCDKIQKAMAKKKKQKKRTLKL